MADLRGQGPRLLTETLRKLYRQNGAKAYSWQLDDALHDWSEDDEDDPVFTIAGWWPGTAEVTIGVRGVRDDGTPRVATVALTWTRGDGRRFILHRWMAPRSVFGWSQRDEWALLEYTTSSTLDGREVPSDQPSALIAAGPSDMDVAGAVELICAQSGVVFTDDIVGPTSHRQTTLDMDEEVTDDQ